MATVLQNALVKEIAAASLSALAILPLSEGKIKIGGLIPSAAFYLENLR
jgi:hypothetical protein